MGRSCVAGCVRLGSGWVCVIAIAIAIGSPRVYLQVLPPKRSTLAVAVQLATATIDLFVSLSDHDERYYVAVVCFLYNNNNNNNNNSNSNASTTMSHTSTVDERELHTWPIEDHRETARHGQPNVDVTGLSTNNGASLMSTALLSESFD